MNRVLIVEDGGRSTLEPALEVMNRVLIVEDEDHLAAGLKLNLEAEGYAADVEDTGEAALARLVDGAAPAADGFDVVLLDVMLPGLDGFEVVRRLRAARQFVPVMLLTARSHTDDVLRGFEAGADDYLPKPFDLSILLARIRGLLRRRRWVAGERGGAGREADEYSFAGRHVDFRNQVLRRGGGEQPPDPDGGDAAALPRAARGRDGVAADPPRGGVGRAAGHRHPDRRQLRGPAGPLHRNRAGPPRGTC